MGEGERAVVGLADSVSNHRLGVEVTKEVVANGDARFTIDMTLPGLLR